MRLMILVAVLMGSVAEAKTLVCASKGEETIYFTTGKLTVKAGVADDDLLTNLEFTVEPKDKLWSKTSQVRGVTTNGWTRFEIGGDAWCSYRLTLPEYFGNFKRQPAFVDASCEENVKSSHRLNCQIR